MLHSLDETLRHLSAPVFGLTEFSFDNRYKKVYKVHQDICFKERCESTSLKKPQTGISWGQAVSRLPFVLWWMGKGSDGVGSS